MRVRWDETGGVEVDTGHCEAHCVETREIGGCGESDVDHKRVDPGVSGFG